MSSSVSNRTFGVEIECGSARYTYNSIQQPLRRKGFIRPRVGGVRNYSFTHDGSGIEIRTPILRGRKGYDELTRLMNTLNELGFYVTRSDGMHVHIGAAFLQEDLEAAKRLASLWLRNQPLITRMCSSHRSGAGAYNINFLEGATKDLGKTTEYAKCKTPLSCNHRSHRKNKQWPGRYNINFSSLLRHGTIEFRIHEGCLDPVKAVAWVQFCQRVIDYVASGKEVKTCKTKAELLRMLGVPGDAISILVKEQPTMPPHPTRVTVEVPA